MEARPLSVLMPATAQVDEPVEHTTGVRATVDIITQSDDHVLRAGPDGVEEGMEGRRAAVDVADGDGATGHESQAPSSSVFAFTSRLTSATASSIAFCTARSEPRTRAAISFRASWRIDRTATLAPSPSLFTCFASSARCSPLAG